MSFSCMLHFAMSSSAFHVHVLQNLHPFGFPRFSPLSVRSPDLSRAPVAPLRPCFRFAFCPCHAYHIMSSCAHLHTCSPHASEHFPRCPFCIPALLCPPTPPFAFFRVWVSNVLGLDRDLPSGVGTLPVDRLSCFVQFGLRLILQRLTGEP